MKTKEYWKIIDTENRKLNIREITNLLKLRYKIVKSPPIIKKYLDELVEEGEIYEK